MIIINVLLCKLKRDQTIIHIFSRDAFNSRSNEMRCDVVTIYLLLIFNSSHLFVNLIMFSIYKRNE